jgi:hypothetical protein
MRLAIMVVLVVQVSHHLLLVHLSPVAVAVEVQGRRA